MHFPQSISQAPVRMQLQRHDWQDPLLHSIRDFQRPKSCITPPESSSSASSSASSSVDPDPLRGAACTSLAASASSVHNMCDSPAVASTGNASSLLPPPVVTVCQHTTGNSQPKPGFHAPAELSFDSAVDLTLSALARSVALRCQCIDQHSPHMKPLCPAIAPARPLPSPPALPKTADAPEVSPSANNSAAQRGVGVSGNLIQPHAAQIHDGCVSKGRAPHHISSQDAACATQPGALMPDTQQSFDAPVKKAGAPGAVQQTPASESAVHPSGFVGYPSESAVHPSHTTVTPSGPFSLSSLTPVQPPGTVMNPSETPVHPSDTAFHPSKTSHYSDCGVQLTSRHEAATLQPAPVLILFSGGVDSTLIAALAHQALPADLPIDLASVCFSGGRSGDRQAALDALQELAQFAPEREWRLIQVDSSLEEVDRHNDWLLGMFVMPCHCCLC